MGKFRGVHLLLLAAALAFALAGCAAENTEPVSEEGDLEQSDPARPDPGDPEYCAYILAPDFWGQGVVLEGNPEMGYILVGFKLPAGTKLYAPFDGLTGPVTLEDYSSHEICEGCSLCDPDSLNGFSAYNVAASARGTVKAGDILAEVSSDQYIFPKHYGKVNFILEFNLFDTEAAGYAEMRTLFEQIFDHLLEQGKGDP